MVKKNLLPPSIFHSIVLLRGSALVGLWSSPDRRVQISLAESIEGQGNTVKSRGKSRKGSAKAGEGQGKAVKRQRNVKERQQMQCA